MVDSHEMARIGKCPESLSQCNDDRSCVDKIGNKSLKYVVNSVQV